MDLTSLACLDHGLFRSNYMFSFEARSIIEKFHFGSFGVEKHCYGVVKVGNLDFSLKRLKMKKNSNCVKAVTLLRTFTVNTIYLRD